MHGTPIRTVMVGTIALLVLAIAASAQAAAPGYGDWSAPVDLPKPVNTPGNVQGPAISADGLSLYYVPGFSTATVYGLQDIYVSQRASLSSPWGPSLNLGPKINTSANEFVPAFSTDGHWMFFASDRTGIDTFGAADIYGSYRLDIHDDLAWETPKNLGPDVNSATDDNGVGYFDNGGAPQLFFGSGRNGGTTRDLFLSHLENGIWGPATPITELNSLPPGTENRPSVRRDGLEIFFYSNREGSVGNDLWTSTRDSVDEVWRKPISLGTTVNSSGSEVHPSLSADGRQLYYSSDRPGGLGGSDLYVITRDAKLTVTANNESRLFGQANPPLTYAITGFVGGETSAMVSGAAACSTTAMPFSPAGSYPISCTAGSLSGAGYVFETFGAGTLTVAYTRPCLTGPHAGPLRVAAGEAVCVGTGGLQTGPVTVSPGGSLDVEGGRIVGPLTATGAAAVRICGATLTGPLTISGSTGLVLVGGDAATGPCAANTIVGPVRLTENTAGVELNSNKVTGPLRITGTTGSVPEPDTGPVHALGNSVAGPVTIQL